MSSSLNTKEKRKVNAKGPKKKSTPKGGLSKKKENDEKPGAELFFNYRLLKQESGKTMQSQARTLEQKNSLHKPEGRRNPPRHKKKDAHQQAR